MPSLIETRPFTIHPDSYAWPSFRIFSERAIWLYLVLLVAIASLIKLGMQLSVPISILTAAGLVGVAFGMSYLKYKAFLGKPENRQIYRNCVVSLTDDEVRQDYTDGSFMAIELFAVKTFREVGDFFFVFADPQHGIVVPKTAFESPEESREFAERMRRAVGKK
ncbi:MAG: hypothetical protein ACHQ50_11760 [Fimbriimonadales bacterium]